MPRYFFHLRCPGKDVLDASGAELRDPDQAWEAARATAQDLLQQPELDANWPACVFEVTDQTGEIVFELPFAEVIEFKPKLN
jgi:hypothetical protein